MLEYLLDMNYIKENHVTNIYGHLLVIMQGNIHGFVFEF